MAQKKIEIHKVNLEARKALFRRTFPKEAEQVFEFLRLLSIGEINKGRSVRKHRLIKYLHMLTVFFTHIKTPLEKIEKRNLQQFISDLQNDEIYKRDGNHYSESTKQDLKICLKIFLKWCRPTDYHDLTDWIDTRLRKKSPEYLTESEIQKLYNGCVNDEQRFLVVVLFDIGARIEEFLNIRFEDISEPSQSFPYYKINIKDEYSKTEGRNVGAFWKLSNQVIRDYISKKKLTSPTDPVFPKTYDSVRMYLHRLGKRILQKRVHAHLLRKSSATFYASKLNRQQLCVRYGWKFSSDMPDIYIKRAGITEDQIKDVVVNQSMSQLSRENEEMKTRFGLIKEENDRKELEIETLKEAINKLSEKINKLGISS